MLRSWFLLSLAVTCLATPVFCQAGELNKLARWAGLGWSDGYHAHNHEVIGHGPLGGPVSSYGEPTYAQPLMTAPATIQPGPVRPVVNPSAAPLLRSMPTAPNVKSRP